MTVVDDDLMIEDFVMNKGALSVMFELGVEDKSFNELKESPTILISPNTLSKRLKESIKLGLVKKVVGEGEIRSTIDYTLTEAGERLLSQFDDIHNQYFDLKKDIAKLKKQIDEKERQIKKILSEEAGKQLQQQESVSGTTERPSIAEGEGTKGAPEHDETDDQPAATAEDASEEDDDVPEQQEGPAEEQDDEASSEEDAAETDQSSEESPEVSEPSDDEDNGSEEGDEESGQDEDGPEDTVEELTSENEGRKDEIERLRKELNL